MSKEKSGDTNKIANAPSGAWTDMRPLSLAKKPTDAGVDAPGKEKAGKNKAKPAPGA